jgi:hypothetical protein
MTRIVPPVRSICVVIAGGVLSMSNASLSRSPTSARSAVFAGASDASTFTT